MPATIRLGFLAVALAGSVLLVGGCGRSASWSPSGRSVAIDVGGAPQLFEVAGGTFTPLETGGRYALNPTFSPDGKQIAYYGITKADGTRATCDIWVRETGESPGSDRKIASEVLHLKGESPRETATRIRGTMTVAWSPDGRKIAHSRMTQGRGEIEIVDLESGDVTRLGRRGESQIMPAWSPTGTRLAYLAEIPYSRMAEPGLSFDLYVADPGSATSRERIWDSRTQGDLWAYWPLVWSEDAGIVVLKQRQGGRTFEMHLVPASGGKSQLLTGVDTPQATITPNLKAVVYMGSDQSGALVYKRAPFEEERILDRIEPETRKVPPRPVIPAAPLYPVISADGKTVALPLVDGRRELRLYEVPTGRKRVYPIP